MSPVKGATLLPRLLAEGVGTGLLVAVVVGSGIAAQQLSPADRGLQLLQNSTATVFGLAVLIVMFGPISGAHFNPVVTVVDWWTNRRTATAVQPAVVGWYLTVQILGGIGGAVLANVMFDQRAGQISTHHRVSTGHLVGEVVATAGLILLILVLVRTGRGTWAGPAIGAYIGAAYWFTSSTSFANPAVTIGRIFTDTFAGIAPASVLPYIAAQILGAAIGLALFRGVDPTGRGAVDPAGRAGPVSKPSSPKGLTP